MSPAHFWMGASAEKSLSSRLGAILNLWSLSVVTRWLAGHPSGAREACVCGSARLICRSGASDGLRDDDQFLGRSPSALRSFLACHSRDIAAQYPAVQCIAAQTKTRLFLNMCERDQIRPLSAARRTAAVSPQPTCTDANNMAQSVGWEVGTVLFDKPKSHCFRPAKNWVAFFLRFPTPP